MRRKSFLVLGIVLFFLLAVILTLVFLVRYEPDFYRASAVAEGPQRSRWSKEFEEEFWTKLIGGITGEHKQWRAVFKEQQINSYFAEGFIQSGVAEKMLPQGVSEPRISLQQEKILLGFRYGSTEPWSTVISLDLRVWMASKEPNVVAIQLLGIRAGALPVSAKALLEQFADIARRERIDVTWYRHEGHPVALLRFQGSQPRQTWQLQQVQVLVGKLVIGGRSIDPAAQAMMMPQPVPAKSPAQQAEIQPPQNPESEPKLDPIPVIPFSPKGDLMRGN